MSSQLPFVFGYDADAHSDEMEKHYFWTYCRKYCNNPIPHIFGSLPCCAGLHVSESGIDWRDLSTTPLAEKPLITIRVSS